MRKIEAMEQASQGVIRFKPIKGQAFIDHAPISHFISSPY